MKSSKKIRTMIVHTGQRSVSRQAGESSRVVMTIQQERGDLVLELEANSHGAIGLRAYENSKLHARPILTGTILVDENSGPDGFAEMTIHQLNRDPIVAGVWPERQPDPDYAEGYRHGERQSGQLGYIDSAHWIAIHSPRWREGYKAGITAGFMEHLSGINRLVEAANDAEQGA